MWTKFNSNYCNINMVEMPDLQYQSNFPRFQNGLGDDELSWLQVDD